MKIVVVIALAMFASQLAHAEIQPTAGKKQLVLNCTFGGASLLVSLKSGYCSSTENSEEKYRANFLGLGLSAGGEGGTLQIVCVVNADDKFAGMYFGPSIYGYAGSATGWRQGKVATFYSTRNSSCEVISSAYGLIAESGGAALELVPQQ